MRAGFVASVAVAAAAFLLAACSSVQPHPAPVEDVTDPAFNTELPEAQVTRPANHRVSRGDTLISIALNYGLHYRELALWNNLRDPDLIQVGQILRLSAPASTPTVSAVQAVRSGQLVAVADDAAAGVVVEATAPASTPAPTPSTPASAASAATAPTAAELAADTASTALAVPAAAAGAAGASAASTAAQAPTAAGSALAAAALPAASTAAQVIVQSTVIGRAASATASDTAAGSAPLKTTPLARKYLYSPSLLTSLKQQWDNRNPPAAATVAAAVVTAPTAASDNAPAAVRERFDLEWSWPTANAPSGKFSEEAKGLNFGGARGNPVFASASGEVMYVGTGVKSYGLMVILQHSNDYLTAYAHLDEAFVKQSERVSRGSRIAAFGDSGSDEVMLHFEIRKVGKPIDPRQVLPPAP